MKLVQFCNASQQSQPGIQKNEKVYPLKNMFDIYNRNFETNIEPPSSVMEVIKYSFKDTTNVWNEMKEQDLEGMQLDIEQLSIDAPVKEPGKVVCVGNNYMDHCIEQNVDPPKQPMIFSKWSSCLIGANEKIKLPEDSEQVDYEVELVVVIGKQGKNISEENAMEHVFGYTMMNDVSARDVQFADGQWVRGKSYDTFAPLGPALITKEEIDNPHNLGIRLELNGKPMQDSTTENLIFKIPYIISYLSKGFTFEPGDIIATGTPHGVGVFRDPKVFLKPGDECVMEIEGIGSMKNKVEKETE